MKKYLSLLISFCTFALFSCSKKDTTNPPPDPAGLNSKIKSWAGTDIRSYSYDGSGRCTQIASSTGSKNTYEYLPGKVIQKQFNNQGTNDHTFEYTLDANDVAISETRPSLPGYNGNIVYNSALQPVKKIYIINGQTNVQDFFYSNGNCDSVRFTTDGVYGLTIVKTYYTDKINTISNTAQGRTFLGKESKNLLKTEHYNYADGFYLPPASFEYEFDAVGKVIKENRLQGGTLTVSHLEYH